MSARHRVAGGVMVRGTCRDGHVTEATTDAGRVTWEGPCAHEGCPHQVKARTRVAATKPPDEGGQQPATKTAARKPRVKKVSYDAQPRKRDQQPDPAAGADPAGAGETAGGAAQRTEEQQPAADIRRRTRPAQQPTAAGDDPAPGGEPARRRGIRGRIIRSPAAATAPRPRREFRLPWED